jgi:ribosomal protein L37E
VTGSGRSGTWEFQRNRRLILAVSDVCAICGHPGARTVDHIVAKPAWPRDQAGRMVPGFDGLRNLQPAHGSMGSNATRKTAHNRCRTCGRLCNQSKGDGGTRVRTSRDWYAPG